MDAVILVFHVLCYVSCYILFCYFIIFFSVKCLLCSSCWCCESALSLKMHCIVSYKSLLALTEFSSLFKWVERSSSAPPIGDKWTLHHRQHLWKMGLHTTSVNGRTRAGVVGHCRQFPAPPPPPLESQSSLPHTHTHPLSFSPLCFLYNDLLPTFSSFSLVGIGACYIVCPCATKSWWGLPLRASHGTQ